MKYYYKYIKYLNKYSNLVQEGAGLEESRRHDAAKKYKKKIRSLKKKESNCNCSCSSSSSSSDEN